MILRDRGEGGIPQDPRTSQNKTARKIKFDSSQIFLAGKCMTSEITRASARRKHERRRSPGGVLHSKAVLPRSFLEQSLLQLFLALDAMPRPRNCLQALGIDLFAAVNAL